MIKCRVEAGVGGHFALKSQPNNIIYTFGENAVHLSITSPGQTVEELRIRDLRVSNWITIQFETDNQNSESVQLFARESLDRVVDILSTLAGEEVRLYHWQVFFTNEHGQWVTTSRPQSYIHKSPTLIDLQPFLESKDIEERHYRALRHLRHGLAHTSPEKRFSSLLLAVLILSRLFPPEIKKTTKCPNCAHTISQHGPGERDYLLNLCNVVKGWPAAEIDNLWKLRNAILAHGNEHLDSSNIQKLQEASMTAARLAYDVLKASLPNLDISGPAQSWFFQDTFMLMDAGDHAHEGAIDVGIQKAEDGSWVTSWPPGGALEVRKDTAVEALREIRRLAQNSMNHYIKTTEPPTSLRLRVVF